MYMRSKKLCAAEAKTTADRPQKKSKKVQKEQKKTRQRIQSVARPTVREQPLFTGGGHGTSKVPGRGHAVRSILSPSETKKTKQNIDTTTAGCKFQRAGCICLLVRKALVIEPYLYFFSASQRNKTERIENTRERKAPSRSPELIDESTNMNLMFSEK